MIRPDDTCPPAPACRAALTIAFAMPAHLAYAPGDADLCTACAAPDKLILLRRLMSSRPGWLRLPPRKNIRAAHRGFSRADAGPHAARCCNRPRESRSAERTFRRFDSCIAVM